jgi:hypothetical protein
LQHHASKKYEELLLLAGNGYGNAATKLLRSFYERVVTFSYLNSKRDKISQFIKYSDIHWYKLLQEAEESHGPSPLEPEKIQSIRMGYDASKDEFMDIVCKSCDRKRIQLSWTKAPIHEMAKQVSDRFENSTSMHT